MASPNSSTECFLQLLLLFSSAFKNCAHHLEVPFLTRKNKGGFGDTPPCLSMMDVHSLTLHELLHSLRFASFSGFQKLFAECHVLLDLFPFSALFIHDCGPNTSQQVPVHMKNPKFFLFERSHEADS